MGKLPSIESEEIKSLSRLIIGKILSSDLLKFIDKTTYKQLNDALISQRPDESLSISFSSADHDKWSWTTQIGTLVAKWVVLSKEDIDTDGSLLSTFLFQKSVTIQSVSLGFEENVSTKLRRHAEFAACLNEVLQDIDAFVPSSLKLKTLTKEQRIARNEQRDLDNTISEFTNVIRRKRKGVRSGLRRGGSSRHVPPELIANFKEGTYEIIVNNGSDRSPNYQRYLLDVPKSNIYGGSLRRIS